MNKAGSKRTAFFFNNFSIDRVIILIHMNAFETICPQSRHGLHELQAFNSNELISRVGCDRSAQLSAINNWSGRYIY